MTLHFLLVLAARGLLSMGSMTKQQMSDTLTRSLTQVGLSDFLGSAVRPVYWPDRVGLGHFSRPFLG
ncbi:hypothetical protein U1Q18_023278, partial [Sarracenia purpurea var. burkii]